MARPLAALPPRQAHALRLRLRLLLSNSSVRLGLARSRGATTACGQALTPRVRLVLLQIFEKTPERVKNFGIWFRYDSRTGTHNAYKEFREMALTDAINSCYQDMAGRSRAKSGAIQILKTAELKPEECKRPTVKQFHTSSIKFPLPHRIAKTPKEFKSTFKASKPTTFC